MSNNTKSYLNLSFICRIWEVIFFQFHIFQVIQVRILNSTLFMILLHIREFQMLMMLLQNSPSLLEQLGGGATLIQKELERREKVEKMNVRQIFSLSPGLFPRAQDGSQHISHNTPCLPSNIFHLSFVFSFSWGDCNTQEKWLCKICRREVGGANQV